MDGGIPVPSIATLVTGACLRHFAIAVGIMVLATGICTAGPPSAPGTPRQYDIPAQTLDDALDAYIRASGAQVLYEITLTKGLRSMAVEGQFTPDAALETLLAGTGLAVRRADIDSFVIVPGAGEKVSPAASLMRSHANFMSALQTGVLAALCRTPLTRPGEYKIAIELWVAPTGIVQRSALVGSTGNAERDGMLHRALRGTSIRLAPPSNIPQPFILTIAPRPPDQTGDCAG